MIYKLVDPRDGRARYVGKTSAPKTRLEAHRTRPQGPRLRPWIAELAALGLAPDMVALDGYATEAEAIAALRPDLNIKGGSTRTTERAPKSRAITFWCTDAQRAALKRAAGEYGISVWARAELLRIAGVSR